MTQLGPTIQLTDVPVKNVTFIQLRNDNILVAYSSLTFRCTGLLMSPAGQLQATLHLATTPYHFAMASLDTQSRE